MSRVEELEARVAHLEEVEARRRDVVLDSHLQGTAYGLGLVHADTQVIRAEMATRHDVDELRAEMNGRVDELRAEMSRRFDELGSALGQLLARLPEQR